MVTLTRTLVSELTAEDIKTFKTINTGLNYYKSYFLSLTWFKKDLDYKEYYVLYTGFYCFYHEILLNQNKVELYKIDSFIRSFKLLLIRLEKANESPQSMLRSFLINSISEMVVILSELLESK